MLNDIQRRLEIGSASEREAAVHALEAIGTRQSVELLHFAAKDDNSLVQKAARNALMKLGYLSEQPVVAAISESKDSSDGYLYLLVNSAMPGLVKIGFTKRSVAERVMELSTASGVPIPFVCAYHVSVQNPVAAEACIHKELQAFRCADNREFFRIDPTEAIERIQSVFGRAPSGRIRR